MVKLITTIAALMMVLILMAEASTHRATMTIRESKESNPSQSEECRRQMQSQQLRQCLEYLLHGRRELPPLLLLLKGRSNPHVLQQCCQQMGQVEIKCRCDAIKQMLQEQEGKLEGEKMRAIVRRARNLPAMCSLEPHRCEFRAST